MAKLRDLITESKYLKREFGEPLPTFKGVMKQHQVNKLKEDWWDDMSPEDQASYIKKHPGSKQAQSAKDDAHQKGMDRASDLAKKGLTKGPGGYGDRGNVRGQDQAYSGEPDDEEYFKSMMGGGDEDEPSHPDDMDDRDVFQFLNKDEPEDDYDMGEVPGSRAPDQDIEPGDPEMRTGDESQEELGNMIKQQQNYIEDLYEKGADREDIEAAEANREDMEREMEEMEDEEESSGRTGKELDQETLTIDGKQYRRISEGVEKQSKPKYEFSEFYQRFKR